MTIISACVVAYNRDSLLRMALSALAVQSRKPDFIIVVDNACLDSTRRLCQELGAIYLVGSESYGSAGGFASAISESLSLGANLVWLLDDDGLPNQDCLDVLLTCMINLNADAVSPLSISSKDSTRTSNSFWLGLRKTDKCSILERREYRRNKIQFYNGVLIKRELVASVGLPDIKLFMRGDELEFLHRSKRAKQKMYLCTKARFKHPSSDFEYATPRSFFLSANVPLDDKKRYYQFRNRGYLVRKYCLIHYLIYDFVRYPITFLVFRKLDFLGLYSWTTLYLNGLLNNLRPFNRHKEI